MLVRAAAGYVALTVAAIAVGCLRSVAFECDAADDCRDAGVAGRCEPSGFCSFPDESCPSEHRYGAHAGDGLGGSCVPVDDGTTGLADTGTSSDDPATSATTSATTGVDETPLTDAPESSNEASLDGESGGDPSTSGASSGDPTGATDTTGAATCPTFADDFEDGVIDPTWSSMGVDFVTEAGGVLSLELSPEVEEVYPGVVLHDLDLADGWVRMHVASPPSSSGVRLYLAVALDPGYSDVVYVMIEGTQVFARRETMAMFIDYGEAPYDAMQHDWLQIRGEAGTVVFEFAPEGGEFVELTSVAAPFALGAASVVVAGANFEVLDDPAIVAVADVEICTSP